MQATMIDNIKHNIISPPAAFFGAYFEKVTPYADVVHPVIHNVRALLILCV